MERVKGSFRLHKYLNNERFLEKSLRISICLESAGKSLKGLEKGLEFYFFSVKLNPLNGEQCKFKIVLSLFFGTELQQTLLFAPWEIFNAFMSSAVFFFKINFFVKSFQEYHLSVKQVGSRSTQTLCRA